MGSSPTSRTMKTKYRIREFIRNDGTRYFTVQHGFFIFWEDMYTRYSSYEDALEAVKEYQAMQIAKVKTHNV